MMNDKLTGRKRYRVHNPFFGKQVMILQVEVKGIVCSNAGGMVDCETQTWWVDARPEWIMESDNEQ